jgi:hypothetical protein
MIYFIFYFSYTEQTIVNNIKENEFIYENYITSFLTNKNFNNLFDKKYLYLKNILIGKYLLFYRMNNDVNNIDNIEKELNKLINLFKENNIIINLLCFIYNDKFIFNSFLNESKKYLDLNIFNYLIILLNFFKIFNIYAYNIYIYFYIFIKILMKRIIDLSNYNKFIYYY